MNYYFYITYSKTADKFYIGHSNDVNKRLKKHNTNHKGFTGKFNDWIVVYTEQFFTKSEAYKRELDVKSKKSRKYIEELIIK